MTWQRAMTLQLHTGVAERLLSKLRTANIPRGLTLHTVVAMHDAYGAYGPMQPLHVRRIARCRAALPFGSSHCAVPITYASAHAWAYCAAEEARASYADDVLFGWRGVCIGYRRWRCAQLIYEDDDNITDLTPRNCSDYCWADQVGP